MQRSYHAPRRPAAARRRPTRARLGLLALLVAAAAGSTAAADEVVTEDAAVAGQGAEALAARTLEALGGAEAWERTRFLSFDFFGARSHHWDRYTGRHRLSGTGRDGESYVVLQDLDDRSGRAWVDGVELEGEARDEWLERAYGAWINDTYWLLMPYKLRDPGVELRALGQEALSDGRTYDVLELSFGDVGLTPGDRYRAYLDPESGLMAAWAYHLEDWEAEREWALWWWRDWARHGEIMLSPTRVAADGTVRELGSIAVHEALPDAVFTSPEPPSAD